MKRLAILISVVAISLGGFSQKGNLGNQPDKCKEKLSLYGDNMKQKLYEDAFKFWNEAVEICPEYNQNLYFNGIYIMKKLKKDASKERIARLSDSVLWAYEQSIKMFGDNPKINERYGADLIIMGKLESGSDRIKKALDSSKDMKIRSSSISYYAQSLALMKRRDKKDCDILVEEYERLSAVIDANKDKKGYDAAQKNVDRFLGPCLTCDKLLLLKRKKFEAAKTNDVLRKTILTNLNKRGCTDNDIYETLALIQCEKTPGADCYIDLGNIQISKGNTNKAIEYFDKAVELTEESDKKVKLLINSAKILLSKGKTGKANSYANKALAIDSKCGAAYLIKAHVIGRSRCGTSKFDDASINWAAYDMAAKAKNIDPSVASEASKAMSSFKSRFPTKTQLFDQNLKPGQSYKTCNGHSTTVK